MSSETAGVPWNEIFEHAEAGKDRGTVDGASGRKLGYQVIGANGGYEFSFRAYDLKQQKLRLAATVFPEQNVFYYTVCTRGFNGSPLERHPDMRAADFVGDILDIVERKRAVRLTTYSGHWINEIGLDDNYREYYGNIAAGMTRQEAAQNTWDGRTMRKYGFKVAEYNIFPSGNAVVTIFKRKP